MKKRILGILSLIIVLAFLFVGCQKEVSDFAYTIDLNSKSYEGTFAGTVEKGAPVDGQGSFSVETEGSGKYLFYSGEWKDGQISGKGSLTAEDYEIDLAHIGKKQGVFKGEVVNGKPNGQGTFESQSSSGNKWIYNGEWKDGQLSGKGMLTDENYEIDLLQYGKRQGKYSGEVVDGIPNGQGTFESQNSSGIKWVYDGEWKNGKMNGQGKMTFQDGKGAVEEGTFTDNEFTPTLVERIQEFGTRGSDRCQYILSSDEKDFIQNNASIFEGKDQKGLDGKIDKTFNINQFKKNPNSISPAFVKISNASIVQISEYEEEGKTVTFCIADTEDYEDVLYFYMIGSSKDAVEDSTVDIILLPIDYTTYKNVNDDDVWAVVGVAVKMDVK